jgi:uncharacterized protein YfaS (alpha-2-macroglobulin family)
MITYNKGEAVYKACTNQVYTFSTDTWADANADSGYPKITIIDPDGTVKVDAASMSPVTTGKYEYEYTLATDAAKGKWSGKIETRYSEKPTIEFFSFAVR